MLNDRGDCLRIARVRCRFELCKARLVTQSVPRRCTPQIGIAIVDNVCFATTRFQDQSVIIEYFADDPEFFHHVSVIVALLRSVDMLGATPRACRMLLFAIDDPITRLEV